MRTGVDLDRLGADTLLFGVDVGRGVGRTVRLDAELLREAERDVGVTTRGVATVLRAGRLALPLRRAELDRAVRVLRGVDRVRDEDLLAWLRDDLLADDDRLDDRELREADRLEDRGLRDADRLDDRGLRDADRRDPEALLADLPERCCVLPAATSGALLSPIRSADMMAKTRNRLSRRSCMAKPLNRTIRFTSVTLPSRKLFSPVNYIHQNSMLVK